MKRLIQGLRWLFLTREQRLVARAYEPFIGDLGALRAAAVSSCVSRRIPVVCGKYVLSATPDYYLLKRSTERTLFRQLMGPRQHWPQPEAALPKIELQRRDNGSFNLRPVIEDAAKADARINVLLETVVRSERYMREQCPEFCERNPEMIEW